MFVTSGGSCHAKWLICMQARRRKRPKQSPGPIRAVQHNRRPEGCSQRQAAVQTGSQVTHGLRHGLHLSAEAHSQQ